MKNYLKTIFMNTYVLFRFPLYFLTGLKFAKM